MEVERIGRYRVVRRIGEGGMGVVYQGHDDRLDRAVAIKVIRPEVLADPAARERFQREARAAARVNHPNICALYEFGEDGGQPYLVMELLTGEPLSRRIARGPAPAEEVFRVGDQILGALSALHQNSVIHRDLKPANIFMTPHGAKLVDFGLAQPSAPDAATHLNLTGAGTVVGTPQDMSPERLFGQPADERSDVWAAAAVLFELAAGTPAFSGQTFAAVVHAIGYDEPKSLPLAAPAALDRVLRDALAKDPARRTPTAGEFANRLRSAAPPAGTPSGSAPAVASGAHSGPALSEPTRFVALPLRVLRPDPDTDFLAFSIPDAVSAALAGLESVIVRAPRALPAGEADARVIGREWAVDVVLAGTLMRAGSLVRVSAQLIDATDGTLRWSDTAQAPLTDLFQLQDALTSRMVSSLHLPLSTRERRVLARQAPANADAYALLMRANGMMTDSSHWPEARDLDEKAVELDPNYAPAWVGLGGVRRLLAKWTPVAGSALLPLAQAALARALAIDPELSAAHGLAASVEVELGLAPDAMVRLLERTATRPRDTALLTGLVIACRYAGLPEPSVAAHARAVSIDPEVRTSVCWTHFYLGDYAAAIDTDTGTPPFCGLASKMLTGAMLPDGLRQFEESLPGQFRVAMRAYRLLAAGKVQDAIVDLRTLDASGSADPEGWFLQSLFMAKAGATDEALTWLERSVGAGFNCHRPLLDQALWTTIRETPRFGRLVERTREMSERAKRLYEQAGGTAILGAVR